MTNVSRLDVVRLFAFSTLLFLLPATSWAQQRPPIAEQIAETYGLNSFGQIEGIRYTFNAEFPGVQLSRTWVWNPKTDTVSYEGKDKEGKPVKVTYQRSQVSSQSDAVSTKSIRHSSTISIGCSSRCTWHGTADVGAEKRIEEFIYHRGGTKKPSVVIATWADYKNPGPLLISTDHRGTADEKPLRVSFSGVWVKVTGSANWMNAQ